MPGLLDGRAASQWTRATSLVFEFMHFVVAVRPKTFIMENVPGMLTMRTPEGVPVVDMLARIAEDGNFMTSDAFKRTMAAQADSVGSCATIHPPKKDRPAQAQHRSRHTGRHGRRALTARGLTRRRAEGVRQNPHHQ